MATEPKEHDALWDLLGKAHNPTLPPHFASNVTAAVSRLESSRTQSPSSKKQWGWMAVGLGVAAAVLFTFSQSLLPKMPAPSEDDQLFAALTAHNFSNGDLVLLDHLDEVIDAELAALWNESL
jgi:hypothetical protein